MIHSRFIPTIKHLLNRQAFDDFKIFSIQLIIFRDLFSQEILTFLKTSLNSVGVIFFRFDICYHMHMQTSCCLWLLVGKSPEYNIKIQIVFNRIRLVGWSDEKRVKIVGVVKILSNICTVKYCQLDKLIKLVSVILFKNQENLGWMVATGYSYLIVRSSKY